VRFSSAGIASFKMASLHYRYLLCVTSVVLVQSRSFLKSRATAIGPSSSVDGSLTKKGLLRTSTPAEGDIAVAPLQEPVGPNASMKHFSDPILASLVHSTPDVTTMTTPAPSTLIATSAQANVDFEVHTMLLWAARAATNTEGQSHPDYHKRSDGDMFGLEVTGKCVPAAAQAHWREAFAHAIELMLQKTMHGMQHGLLQIAHSAVELIESTSCGLLAHDGFEKLIDQAGRLQVLASAGSLNDLDVAVQYEPLKALTVGGVDIHLELNALIVAWQLNKGPEEVGRALTAFLRDFREEDSTLSEDDSKPDVGAQDDLHETRTSAFWVEVLQAAMQRLGGGHELMSDSCVSTASARKYGDALEDAISRMMQKTRQGMRHGIEEMSSATVAFVDALQAPCSEAIGALHLRSAAARLHVFASAKMDVSNVFDFAKHVEYEPMKVLKVGGVDVHKELNRFLVAWIHKEGATPLAEGLVDFFEDFKEHEVEEQPMLESNESSDSNMAEEPVVLAILRDAVYTPLSTVNRDELLPSSCLTQDLAETFTRRVETSLEHMLQKRKKTMQFGLRELADVTDEVFGQMADAGCGLSEDAGSIRKGARKLKALTRKTVVDYGTHIKYEAMKGLVVGDVDIHIELNAFIGAWKLRSPREAGSPYGELMRKLLDIKGHDEL
jgi:hypothetical protein